MSLDGSSSPHASPTHSYSHSHSHSKLMAGIVPFPPGPDEIPEIETTAVDDGIDDGATELFDKPGPTMLTTTIREFVTSVNVSVDCVINVVRNPNYALGKYCKVVSIDDEKIATIADLRQIIASHRTEHDVIVVGFLPPTRGRAGSSVSSTGSSAQRGGLMADISSFAQPLRSASEAGDSLSDSEDPQFKIDEILDQAVDRAGVGVCIVVMCHGQAQTARIVGGIESIAKARGTKPVIMDAGVNLHRRPRQEQVMNTMVSALTFGDWLVIANATKSMSTLNCLETVLTELLKASGETKPISRASRVFVVTEPHPHFPQLLTKGAIMFKISDNKTEEEQVGDTLRDSMSKLKLITTKNISSRMSCTMSELPKRRRKVRMASEVDVVPFDANSDNQNQASSMMMEELGNPGGEPLPQEVRRESSSLSGEQFTCLRWAGPKRFVAGSNGGNFYVMDLQGKQHLTFHGHECSVWDMDFASPNEFVSASEDASVTEWKHDPFHKVHGYAGKVISRFSNDVLAVRFVDNPGNCDTVVSGGLNGSLVFVNRSSGKRQIVPTVSTILSLCRLSEGDAGHSNRIAMGGGTGLVTVWDTEKFVAVDTFFHHKQKVSCVDTNAGMIISSSFDCSVVLSDIRSKHICTRLGNLPGPVTALTSNENHVVCGAEDMLSVYDIRKPNSLLFRRVRAWTGIVRGLLLDLSEGFPIVISSSSDGMVRFFGCQ